MKKFQIGKTRTVELVLVVDYAEVWPLFLTYFHITVIITGHPQYSFTFCASFLVQEVRQEDCDSEDACGGEPRRQGTSWGQQGPPAQTV